MEHEAILTRPLSCDLGDPLGDGPPIVASFEKAVSSIMVLPAGKTESVLTPAGYIVLRSTHGVLYCFDYSYLYSPILHWVMEELLWGVHKLMQHSMLLHVNNYLFTLVVHH